MPVKPEKPGEPQETEKPGESGASTEDGARDTEDTGEAPVSVRPLERGLAVLRALSAAADPVRAGDLVRATGLARATVDRVTATLVTLGLLRRRGQELMLTPRLMALGNAYMAAAGLTGEVAARTARLADEFDESVSLAVPDGDGVRFVAQAPRRRTLSVEFRIGDLLPAERCAPGALFAADWDAAQWAAWRERRAADPEGAGFPAVAPRSVPGEAFAARAHQAAGTGWALDDQLIEPGLIAVSVPVRAAAGGVRWALSAVSHTSRHTAQGLADLVLPRLRATADELSALLAAYGGTDTAGGHVPPLGAAATPADGPAAVTRAAKAELGPDFLQSLARGLAVLEALGAAHGPGLPLTALAAATRLPRATARRCLHTLVREGYAAYDGRCFRPLPRVLELGCARLSRLPFAELVEPHLRDLADLVHEPVSVAVLDGADIRYVARAAAARIMSPRVGAPGTRLPAYPTALGRVLLAGLPDAERARLLAAAPPRALTRHTVTAPERLTALVAGAAEEGWASVDEELEEGLRAVAVPLRAADGRVVAALNVAQHAARGPLAATRAALLPALRTTAAAIEADLHTASRFHPVREP